jgi:uncharacterized protein (TIRG00374 family)
MTAQQVPGTTPDGTLVDDGPVRSHGVRWGTIIGLSVSAVSVYFAVKNLRPGEVLRAFADANYVWIAPAVVLYLFALGVRTLRWRALLAHERVIPLRRLLPTMAMGRAANNIYPFRTGEIVRVLLLHSRNEIPVAVGLASILVERIFDGLTMILILILAAVLGGIPDYPYLRYFVWAAPVAFGGALALVYTVALWPGPVRGAAGWLIGHLSPRRFRSRLLEVAERFIGGFASARSAKTITLVLALSILVWTAETISYRLLMNSFGFSVNIHQLLLMSGAANLGTALPSGPANVGTFDLPAIEVLSRSGASRAVAASYQTLLHAVLWSTETLAGVWFMWRTGLRRADLQRSMEDGASPGAAAEHPGSEEL